MTRPAIVLDCDPGVDDAFAIFAAARVADLVAITTVTGNVSLDKTTRNALAIVELAGLDVPVHAGAATPLVPHDLDASAVHGATGLGDVVLPEPSRPIASDDAVGALVDIVRSRDDIHLVAVGPLTNVALAIRRDPGFAKRLRSLTVMGGAACGGNVTAAAEFNIHVDPEAAAIVFGCGVTVRLVPLDLTHRVIARREHVDQLRRAGTRTAAFAADLLDDYDRLGAAARVTGLGALHDPCAVLAVSNPEWFGFVPRRVDIELDGRLTRGMTVVDARAVVTSREQNALMGCTVDADRVMRTIVAAAIDPKG